MISPPYYLDYIISQNGMEIEGSVSLKIRKSLQADLQIYPEVIWLSVPFVLVFSSIRE